MILAQLTDTHIRSRRQIAYGRVDTCSMFETTISHINSFRPNVDAVIVTGDITDRGELDAFHLFREIINDLVPPWYVVPGNHDNRENFLQVFSDCQHFNQNSDFICYSIEDYPVRLVGIDTTVENKPYGFLAEERLLWLDTCLAENPEKPTILFQHHPPFYTGINHMDVQNLLNGRELIQLLTRHRQVRHVACGHVHRASETCIDGVGISIAPNAAHSTTLDLDPSGPSAFSMDPPAVRIFRVDDDGRIASHLSYLGIFDGPHPYFAPDGKLVG
jgi:3',5'-cyclic AMP phosphodiesterase CpdA